MPQLRAQDLEGHGTINVVLGNKNGIVVLTDSQITRGDGQLSPIPAQKLFKLDDLTVCTFAGFAFASGKGNFFYTGTGAIINEFARQLATNPQPVSLDEKVKALSYLLSRQLTVLATLRQGEGIVGTADYFLELTVVGYDRDGLLKIAQINLKNTISMAHVGTYQDNFNLEVPQAIEVVNVAKPLVKRLAGIRDIADTLLENPQTMDSEPAIHKYAEAKAKDDGESLTIQEMSGFAEQLELQTHLKHPGIGGANQVAVLRNGHVISVEQGVYPQEPRPLFDFTLFSNSSYASDETGTFGCKSQFHPIPKTNGPAQLFITSVLIVLKSISITITFGW